MPYAKISRIRLVIRHINHVVPELTPVYLLKVTGSFMGISEKGIPLGIWNSTAGEPQPGHKAGIRNTAN